MHKNNNYNMNPENEITVLYISYKSENIIEKSIKNFDNKIKILVVENSNDHKFKNYLEKKFSNVEVVLTGFNLGVSKAVNIGLKKIITKYTFFLNPDAQPTQECLFKLYSCAEKNINGAIFSPKDINNPKKKLFGFFEDKNFYKKDINFDKSIKKVDWVAGGAMFFRNSLIKKVNLFDENYFLDFEEIDICYKVKKNNFEVIFCDDIYTNNLLAKSVNVKNKNLLNRQRQWHYGWSMFYFYKKNYSFSYSIKKTLPQIIKSFIFIFINIFRLKFFVSLNNFYFIYGSISSILGLKSFYRIKI